MKRIYLLLAILLGSLQLANAQQQTLQFNKDGKFKIVQFTDVHYIYNDPRSDVSIERINQVLDMEKPDLVLFTGDVIYGKPAEEGMRTVLNLVSKRKILWRANLCATFLGNLVYPTPASKMLHFP